MDFEAGEYKKLAIRQFPARELRETAEGKYWKQFRAPLSAKQIGAVSSIDFCRQYPHHFAVTSSTRVVVYDAQTCSVRRTFSRFKDKAYSGNFRGDGRLLVAGGEEGIVQVFDAGSRGLLRQLPGHKRAVHVTRFAPDKLHILSGGDDALVRWWDMSEGKQVLRLRGHADYVRAAAVNPASHDTWATGGYDHVCKLWDVRSGQSAVALDHGAPIESLAFFPTGSLLVTAGGRQLCVWDLFSGGRLLRRLSNHQKTITSVLVSPAAGPDGAVAPRMLSGSLDGHVKVYELDTFQVTHASKYPAPVLSLGLSPNCGLLAVGMADGTLSVRRHARPRTAAAALGGPGSQPRRQRYKARLTAASYRYFVRGQSSQAAAGDYVVAARKRAALSQYDRLLRKFRYGDALQAALATKRPEVVASLLEELAARGGLSSALAGPAPQALLPLLEHIRRHVGDPRYSQLLAGVAHRILDAYAGSLGREPQVDELYVLVREKVRLELQSQEALARVKGMLEPLLAAGAAGHQA